MDINATLKKTLFLCLLGATHVFAQAQSGVRVSPKLFLAGSYEPSGTMRDDLRYNGILPNKEPYSVMANFNHYGGGGGETVTDPAVFQVMGDDAIVDWVMVELRSNSNLKTPVSTRSALLQRDGDVVSTDGVSPVHFAKIPSGDYHVSVRHRNHLGVMTAQALHLTKVAKTVDFTSMGTQLWGTNPCNTIGKKRVLWLGDANVDKKVIHQGPNNDIFNIYTAVLSAPGNTTYSGNFMLKGYFTSDLNMDGFTTFYGPNNDRAYSFQQIAMSGAGVLNLILREQIPN